METKKSDRANLEKRRAEGFLLGLVLALALLFAALEYTSRPDGPDRDEDQFDDLTEELDLTSYNFV